MKKLIVLVVITTITLSIIYGYRIFKQKLKTDIVLHTKVANITDKIDEIGKATKKKAEDALKDIKKAYRKTSRRFSRKLSPGGEPVEGVVLYLKHGGVISGEFLGETENNYSVEWKNQEFVIDKSRVKRVEYKTQKSIEWPYKNDVVVKRTNGVVLDGEITDVKEHAVTLLYLEGGGRAEVDIEKKYIECILFAPAYNKESEEIEENLKKLFPDMEIYKEGVVTVITDSHTRWASLYRKEIRFLLTEIYFKFFGLFKGKKPIRQNFVVIFDDYFDYLHYALTDGVPGWAVRGYFSPSNKAFYTYNAYGERFEKLIFDVVISKSGKAVEDAIGGVKERVDKRYHMTLDGVEKEIKDMYWTVYNVYKAELSKDTLKTLRHEFTHEVFHNWGLQDIILSKTDIDKDEEVEKKKEFLETEDPEEKEKLLKEILGIKEKEYEDIEVEAAQSWLAEGVATYCATNPIGSINERWLFRFQEMTRKNEINPIEFLMVFKMGSFPELSTKGALNAYAQSWALTKFLMDKYPDQFIAYQRKMSDESPQSDDEELEWLLELVDRDLPTLEKEFKEYMGTFEEVDDPYVKRVTKWHELWDSMQWKMKKY